MPDMFNAAEAIGMYASGQDRRVKQLELQRAEGMRALYAKIKPPTASAKGGDQVSGVTGAVPPLAAPVAMPPGMAPTPMVPAAPTGPQTVPTAHPDHPDYTIHTEAPQSWIAQNQAVLDQAMGVDPAQAFALYEHLGKMDDRQRAQVVERGKVMGQAALLVSQEPPAKRAAAWDSTIDALVQQGYTDLAQYKGHYSEDALRSTIAGAGLAEQFQKAHEIKWVARPGDGGGLIATDGQGNLIPEGDPRISGVQTNSAPVVATTKADYDALPTGSPYIAPDGSHRIKGGAAPSATATFPVIADAQSVVKDIFPNARITSWRRDPNSRLGRANPTSYHNNTGGAVDVAPIPGMTFAQYVNGIKARGYHLIEAIDEASHPLAHTTGPNWHVVIGGRANG